MIKITNEQIEHIADLSRIELSKNEKENFSRDLSSIIDYVEKLKEVNTNDVSETSQVTGLENVYRDDSATELTQININKDINRKELLKNAPEEKDGYIKVKAVLE